MQQIFVRNFDRSLGSKGTFQTKAASTSNNLSSFSKVRNSLDHNKNVLSSLKFDNQSKPHLASSNTDAIINSDEGRHVDNFAIGSIPGITSDFGNFSLSFYLNTALCLQGITRIELAHFAKIII